MGTQAGQLLCTAFIFSFGRDCCAAAGTTRHSTWPGGWWTGQLSLSYMLQVDSMDEQKWQKVELGNKQYLFQLVVEKGMVGDTCYLTDMVNIFKEEVDKDKFSEIFSRVNGDLELDDICEGFEEVVGVMNKNDASKKVKGEVLLETCSINVEWVSEGIPYKWIFSLVRGSSSEFHDMITMSLLQNMARLIQEKKELVSIIRSKDLELEDYENSGAKLTRKALKTTWFTEEEAFSEKDPVQVNDEVDFMTSRDMQYRRINTRENSKQDDTELPPTSNDSASPLTVVTKENTPNLDSKRKIVKPDLSKIADKLNNKKRKLNSL